MSAPTSGPAMVALLTASIHGDDDTVIALLDELPREDLYPLIGSLIGAFRGVTASLAGRLGVDADAMALEVLQRCGLTWGVEDQR